MVVVAHPAPPRPGSPYSARSRPAQATGGSGAVLYYDSLDAAGNICYQNALTTQNMVRLARSTYTLTCRVSR